MIRIAATSLAAAFVVVLTFGLFAPKWPLLQSSQQAVQPAAEFIGSETCSGCHQAQAASWSNSQHKHAMDHATEKSVLGDFTSATFDYNGVRSRFFRGDGKYLVETDGPDGKLATFQIKYTFGIDPLQQYLIEFPDGRVQALAIAWDARPKEKGGQRWFHLYPDEKIGHDDVLHWTKLNQNWNFMCAECHSTGLRKNYDAERDRYVFAGDSPNDQPMFAYFPNAVGVANVLQMADLMSDFPKWITPSAGSAGFAELADALIPTE